MFVSYSASPNLSNPYILLRYVGEPRPVSKLWQKMMKEPSLANLFNKLRHAKQSIIFNLAYPNLCIQSADLTRLSTQGDRQFLSPDSLFSLEQIPLKDTSTVHLYGAGRSIVDWFRNSGHLRDEHELHVGFNWSGLLDCPFDVYFFEIYGNHGIHKKGVDVAKSCLYRGAKVYLKSLYIHNTSDGVLALEKAMGYGIKWIDTFYCPDFRVNTPFIDPWSRALYLKALFHINARPNMWPDGFSSPLTIIALLRRVGYTKFILHGFDLDDSDYFFRYSTDCIAESLLRCIPDFDEKPPLKGTQHDSKKCTRLNLPLMLDLINKYGYAQVEYAKP